MEIGKIKMRTPGGLPSVITVTVRGTAVDIHLSRSEEGEAVFMLPGFAAKRLGELLGAATKFLNAVPTRQPTEQGNPNEP